MAMAITARKKPSPSADTDETKVSE